MIESRVLEDSSTELREVRVVSHLHHCSDTSLVHVSGLCFITAFIFRVALSTTGTGSSHLLGNTFS